MNRKETTETGERTDGEIVGRVVFVGGQSGFC